MAKKYIDADLLKKEVEKKIHTCRDIFERTSDTYFQGRVVAYKETLSFIDSLQQEQQEVDLEKFTEKMDAWKARYNYPDNIPIKATMAFTARMFYMYPDVAKEWYDSLRKVTLD